jgi:Arylsulfotransferase (ASST)
VAGTRRQDLELTRDAFLRRSAAGALALGGAFATRFAGDAFALPAAAASPANVLRFRSRLDIVTPYVNVRQKHAGRSAGHIFLAPNSGPGHRGPLIIDDDADPVWFHNTRPVVAMNFRAAVFRGKPVLTWWEGKSINGLGHGTHVVVDDAYRELMRVPAGNGRPSDLHEFIITERGTALVTAWEKSVADLTAVGGPASGPVIGGVVQELELPSGRVLFEWRSLDHVAIGESFQKWTSTGAYDYFHVNSIELDRDGNLLVSARNTWAIYKLDRGSGDVIWRLGGKQSDFQMGPGTAFAWQHDARRHGGSEYLVSVFDDGAAPAVQPQSKGLILKLDQTARRATLHRHYAHYPNVLAHALGSVQVVPNSNVVVGWGTAPFITEFRSDGKVLWDAQLPEGAESYRALRLPWVGRPARRPDAIVEFVKGRHNIYVSWNGATELAHWRLASAKETTVHPRTGFETEIVAPVGVKTVALTPLDAGGAPLHPALELKV